MVDPMSYNHCELVDIWLVEFECDLSYDWLFIHGIGAQLDFELSAPHGYAYLNDVLMTSISVL